MNEEIELGVVIGKHGRKVPESQAMDLVGGYCLALDMTATCRIVLSKNQEIWSINLNLYAFSRA